MEVKIQRICEYCETIFYVIPSRLKHGRGRHCSPACQYATRKNKPKSGVVRKCLNCHAEFYIPLSKAIDNKRGLGKYCSRKCRDEHWKGKNTPNYINGNRSNWHGPNWYSQRRKTLKRDNYTCQNCGLTKEQSKIKFNQPLVVHHKIPFRLFNGDYKRANDLINLITLCHSCHRAAEAEFQRNERRGQISFHLPDVTYRQLSFSF